MKAMFLVMVFLFLVGCAQTVIPVVTNVSVNGGNLIIEKGMVTYNPASGKVSVESSTVTVYDLEG